MRVSLPESTRQFLVLLAAYFALQVLVRILLGCDQLEIDEAEQLLLAQRLQPGYSGQPPLYTWIQIAFFTLFGYNVFAIALVKNLLLFGLYLSSYFIARHLSLTPALSVAAALSMLLLPQIGWESQRDLTHSVLVTCVASITLWLVLSMLDKEVRYPHYLLLGLLMGVGTLSKWNYLFFLLALVMSLLSLRQRLILHPGFALSLFVAALLVSPYGVWMVESYGFATASLKKLDADTMQTGALQNFAFGVLDLSKAGLQFAGLFVITYLLTVRARPRGCLAGSRISHPKGVALLLRLLGFLLLVLLLFLMLSGASAFKDRWLLPLMFYLPLLFFVLTPSAALTARVIHRYSFVLLLSMMLIPMGLLGRVYLGPYFDRFTKPHYPAAALAAGLREKLSTDSVIVAQDVLIAGNLKLHLPDHFVTYSSVDFKLPESDEVILVWNGREGKTPPIRIRQYLNERLPEGALDSNFKGSIEAPLRLSREKLFKLRYQRYLPQR